MQNAESYQYEVFHLFFSAFLLDIAKSCAKYKVLEKSSYEYEVLIADAMVS